MKNKIGILGGTFNPIHLGHLIMAEQALEQLNLDEVRFMPDYLPPHIDDKKTIDANKRVEMVELAIKGNPHFKIEMSEIERQGKSYTYDSITAMKAKHPNEDYYFILGEDMADYLDTWYHIDELVDLVHFVGFKRPNSAGHSNYPVKWINSPEVDISSTLIRKMVKEGMSVRYLTPELVLDYIKKEHLYE